MNSTCKLHMLEFLKEWSWILVKIKQYSIFDCESEMRFWPSLALADWYRLWGLYQENATTDWDKTSHFHCPHIVLICIGIWKKSMIFCIYIGLGPVNRCCRDVYHNFQYRYEYILSADWLLNLRQQSNKNYSLVLLISEKYLIIHGFAEAYTARQIIQITAVVWLFL